MVSLPTSAPATYVNDNLSADTWKVIIKVTYIYDVNDNLPRIRGLKSFSLTLMITFRGYAEIKIYKSGTTEFPVFLWRLLLPGIVEEIRPHPWKNTKLSQLNHIKLLQA